KLAAPFQVMLALATERLCEPQSVTCEIKTDSPQIIRGRKLFPTADVFFQPVYSSRPDESLAAQDLIFSLHDLPDFEKILSRWFTGYLRIAPCCSLYVGSVYGAEGLE